MKFLPIIFLSIPVLALQACENSPSTPSAPDTTSHGIQWSLDTVGTFQSVLYGVWALDSNLAYSVGLIRWSDNDMPSDIARWDGSAWRRVDHLTGLLCGILGFAPNDVWAVGEYLLVTRRQALITHWNGTGWTDHIIDTCPGLWSVWGTSSRDLFAVGDSGTILHFNGVSWSRILTNTQAAINSISGTSSGICAVGGDISTGSGLLIQRRDGGILRVIHSSPAGPGFLRGPLHGVWSTHAGLYYIVGVNAYRGIDTSWSVLSLPNESIYMQAIGGDGDNNIFVGGDSQLIMHYNGASWHRYDQFLARSKIGAIRGLWAGKGTVFLVGTTEGRAIVYRGIKP